MFKNNDTVYIIADYVTKTSIRDKIWGLFPLFLNQPSQTNFWLSADTIWLFFTSIHSYFNQSWNLIYYLKKFCGARQPIFTLSNFQLSTQAKGYVENSVETVEFCLLFQAF